MADCKCDLGNILDEETFNVRVIRELCNISNSVGTTELLRMVDQTDDGDVQFIRTSNGDFKLDGETSYTPIGTVIPYKKESGPEPEPIIDDGIFRFTVNVNSTANIYYFDVNYSPSVSDYIVDWGDNTTSVGLASHTYASTGIYQISISAGSSNVFPFIKFNNNGSYLISVDSVYPYINYQYWGNTFTNSSISKVCRGLFKNNPQIKEVNAMFRGCVNLETIPDDLCLYLTNVIRMNNFLRGSGIKEIPKGLLDNCGELLEIYSFCQDCVNLTTIPEYLFRYNSKCYSFDDIFNGCIKLKLIKNIFCDEATEKNTRFASMPGVGYIYFTTSFNRTSYTGSDPGEAPSLWEYTYQPTLYSNNCFAGAGNSTTSISNYNSIPSAWGGPA